MWILYVFYFVTNQDIAISFLTNYYLKDGDCLDCIKLFGDECSKCN